MVGKGEREREMVGKGEREKERERDGREGGREREREREMVGKGEKEKEFLGGLKVWQRNVLSFSWPNTTYKSRPMFSG